MKGDDPDATVLTPRRIPAIVDEALTIAPPTRPPARTATRRATPRSEEEGPLAIGEPFGSRYHIIRLLGIGGMGAVYQAWDAELGVAVAIKVIRPEVMEDPTAAAEIERRFKRELLLARQVTHKNVVRIHDLGEIDGIKYITMPYVEGADLATICGAKASCRCRVCCALRVPSIGGLVAAHKAGVVHRDLKPANIMIDADDEALIMDFGIARSTGAPTSAAVPGPDTIVRNLRSTSWTNLDATVYGAVVGTVEYMAPEQAKGQPVDQRADIYAFGLILYDMLVGQRRSKKGENPIAELQARMKQAPPGGEDAGAGGSRAVDHIVSRCLEPEADKRFQTSEEVAAALALLDDEGIPIPIPPRFSTQADCGRGDARARTGDGDVVLHAHAAGTEAARSGVRADRRFQNKTGDPTFDHTLEPMLKLALEGAGFISAYDRTGIRALSERRPTSWTRRRAGDRRQAGPGRGALRFARSAGQRVRHFGQGGADRDRHSARQCDRPGVRERAGPRDDNEAGDRCPQGARRRDIGVRSSCSRWTRLSATSLDASGSIRRRRKRRTRQVRRGAAATTRRRWSWIRSSAWVTSAMAQVSRNLGQTARCRESTSRRRSAMWTA